MTEETNNLSNSSPASQESNLTYQTPELRKHGTIHDITLAVPGANEAEGPYSDAAPPTS